MRRALGLVVGLVAVGCGSKAEGDAGGGAPAWDPTAPAACGLADYQWLPAAAVGAVLEDEVTLTPTAAALEALLPAFASVVKLARVPTHDVTLHRIRYQTQDRGRPVEATALVAVPTVSSPTTLPVYAFLHGTTGFDDGCAISRNAGSLTDSWTAVSVMTASFGYITVFPDYIGLMSVGGPSEDLLPYLVAEPTAMASLDAVRAARALVAAGGTPLTAGDLVVAGHSQGGHAAAVTVAYAPFYAPELTLRAAAYLAPPLAMGNSFKAILESPDAPVGSLSLGAAYTILSDRWYGGDALGSAFLPAWEAQADSIVRGTCASGYQSPLEGVTDWGAVFQPALVEALHRGGAGFEPWSCYVRENDPTQLRVPLNTEVPVLMVLGELDTLVLPQPQRTAFRELCGRGAQLEYLECAGSDHGGAFTHSVDDVLDFFEARLAGTALPATACETSAPRACRSAPTAP